MKVAAIQMVSSETDIQLNIDTAKILLSEAKSKGAELAVLPENFAYLGGALRAIEVNSSSENTLLQMQDVARDLALTIVAGTIPLKDGMDGSRLTSDKFYASSCVIDTNGEVVFRYDKIHLFDAGVDDAMGQYSESSTFSPGNTPGVFTFQEKLFGIGVCYDIRFPEYFRLLTEAGVSIFIVPAAFTYATGQAHWMTLLKARAIENQCYVVASGQGGQHSEKRRTWGETCIINPWGDVQTLLEQGEGVVVYDLDFDAQQALRKKMPVLSHRIFK